MKKKYIIELCGGLGNQMFQYFLFLFMKQNGYNCYLHADHKYMKEAGGLALTRICPQSSNYISQSRSLDWYVDVCDALRIPILAVKSKISFAYRFFSAIDSYKTILFPMWEEYTFLDKIKDRDKLFSFPSLDNKNAELANEMMSCNSVSIHVRRGDYQKVKKWRIGLGDICNEEYYQRAITEARKRIDSPVFYVFSDDIEWVKLNLNLEDAHYVDWNTGEESYRDMQLMTYCKVNILANSTFSLLGAWLNRNDAPTIIVPEKWGNTHDNRMYYQYVPQERPNWVVINNMKPQVSIIIEGHTDEKSLNIILCQSYTDFEILNAPNKSYLDDRIVTTNFPMGNYVCHIVDTNVFKDKNYLRDWIMTQFTDCES